MLVPIVCAALLPYFVAAGISLDQVFAQLEQQYSLPQNILAKVANVESNGNPTAGSPGKAYGMFQWFARYWQPAAYAAYGNRFYIDPAQRANPTVAAKVTAFSLAQAKARNGSLIQQAGIDLTLGLYMAHFMGQNGSAKFLQAYMQNPGASAAALFPKEARYNPSVFNGRTLAGVLNLFASRLKVAGVSVNATGNFSDAFGNSLAYSSADLGSNDYRLTPYVSTSGDDPYRTYPTNYSATPQESALASGGLPLPQQNAVVLGGAASTTADLSAALIIVQSRIVNRGNPAVISWTSVGMSASAQCQVREGSTIVGEGNEGTRILPTGASSQDAMTFTLTCATRSGSQVKQSVSITFAP